MPKKRPRKKTNTPEPLIDHKTLTKTKGASISLLSGDMKILWANKFLEAIHGPLPKLKGKICYRAYHGKGKICPDCIPIKALSTKSIATGIIKRKPKDGTARYLQSVAVPFLGTDGKAKSVLEILFDVTKSKLLELDLKKSEEFYRTLFEYSGTAIAVNNKEGIIQGVNRQFCELAGYPREAIEGKKHYLEFVVDKDRVQRFHKQRWSKKGISPTKYEYVFRTRKGNQRLIDITTNRIPETDSSIASMIDITEKKALERSVREKEQFLANILRESADGIITVDNDEKIRTWNIGAENIFGYKNDEIIGKKITKLFPKDSAKSDEREMLRKKCYTTGSARNYMTEMLRKDSRRVIVSQTLTLIRDEKKKPLGLALILKDITERKHLEERFIQNEKMSAIGTLSTGLAHEIKNPLNSIVINMEILKNHLDKNTKMESTHVHEKYINIIQDEIGRLDKVIKSFLNYAKPQTMKYKSININDVINNVCELLEAESKKSNVSVVKNFEGNLSEIHGEENQLKQIFLNLLLNSFQAMSNGGKIVIETKNTKDGRVLASFSDTGLGISKEDSNMIFNPFFTTKGEGSGLGLAMVAQLVKNHGGEINFKSREGKGTTFYLSFPVT